MNEDLVWPCILVTGLWLSGWVFLNQILGLVGFFFFFPGLIVLLVS